VHFLPAADKVAAPMACAIPSFCCRHRRWRFRNHGIAANIPIPGAISIDPAIRSRDRIEVYNYPMTMIGRLWLYGNIG
jgi:hypothetical protein